MDHDGPRSGGVRGVQQYEESAAASTLQYTDGVTRKRLMPMSTSLQSCGLGPRKLLACLHGYVEHSSLEAGAAPWVLWHLARTAFSR